MKKLVAIGGGHIGRLGAVSTTSIDKEIIRLAGKKNPRLLFVPTASDDSESYCEIAKKYFGGLGCEVSVLYLVREKPALKDIKKKIFDSDIVYVGGGSTLKMMMVWRKLGVDKVLKRAYERGVVLSGKSAGAICWFDSGISNSRKYRNPKNWKFINVKGLGFIKGLCCPHYDKEPLGVSRHDAFGKMIAKTGGLGIAIDNNCAIEFINGKYFKIVASRPGASAYRVYKKKGIVISENIEQKAGLAPIGEMYKTRLS